jgi:hypothetical protein
LQDLYIFVSIKGIHMRIKPLSFFIILILISLPLPAQEKQLFGFDDLDWYSSKDAVKDYMNKKYDMSPGYERDDALGYQGGSYLKQDLFLWVYFFNEKGLQEVDLVIKNQDRPVGGIFAEVVQSLTPKYGDPDLYKPDDWIAEWYYFDFPGKQLNATIKVMPYSNENMTSIKITFLKLNE